MIVLSVQWRRSYRVRNFVWPTVRAALDGAPGASCHNSIRGPVSSSERHGSAACRSSLRRNILVDAQSSVWLTQPSTPWQRQGDHGETEVTGLRAASLGSAKCRVIQQVHVAWLASMLRTLTTMQQGVTRLSFLPAADVVRCPRHAEAATRKSCADSPKQKAAATAPSPAYPIARCDDAWCGGLPLKPRPTGCGTNQLLPKSDCT